MVLRTKSVWAVGLTLALSASLAGACRDAAGPDVTEGTGQDRPSGEIHVLAFGDAAASAERAAAERFNKTSAIKVVVDTGPALGRPYNAAVMNSMGSPMAPDIFMSWGAAGIKPLVSAGSVRPLDDFVKDDSRLRDAFIPSVMKEEVIDGHTYGIPVRGVAPVFLFHNRAVLQRLGLEPATTLEELSRQVAVLRSAGITPIGLGGADKWPQMLWFQYIYARVIGNAVVARGLGGDAQVWASAESRTALQVIRTLVDSGAFGTGYNSMKYGSDGSAALLRSGRVAYELQGAWHFATTVDSAPAVAGQIGWTAFPSLAGGRGQPREITGNLSNFYNVHAATRYPDTVRDFLKLLYGKHFLADQIGLGNLPPTNNAGELLQNDTALTPLKKQYLTFVVDLISQAPTFQLSWDQTVPVQSQIALQDVTADFFAGTITADDFVRRMQDLVKQK